MIEAGGDTFSMRALAERSGYTAPTLYHHFGDKEGLVAALLEERFARLLAAVQAVPESDDPEQDLRRFTEAFVAFGQENPTFYRLILSGPRGGDRTPPSAEKAREVLGRPWNRLAEAGRLHADAQASGQALWALMHGLTALQIARPDFEWAPDLAQTAIDSMLRGLVRSEASPSSAGRTR